jgi:hypothetical protein
MHVLKDEDSGGVRIQAAAITGELKKSPIWTAFINYKMMALEWNKLVEPRKVHLGDLNPFVFSHDYVPQLGPGGEHELLFEHSRGEFAQLLPFTHSSLKKLLLTRSGDE